METCAGFWDFMVGLGLGSVQWLEWAKSVFDLVKGIAWPLAIFAIVWLFRDPIRARIPFIKEISPTGATFHDGQQPTAQAAPGALLVGDHPLGTVNALAEKVQAEVNAFVPEQRESRLVRALAEARTVGEFEFIYANIFNSQLDALRELSKREVSLDMAQAFFDEEVLPRNPELFSSWGFEKWSAYLLAQGLISVEGQEVKLTMKGQDFIKFVDQAKVGFRLVN